MNLSTVITSIRSKWAATLGMPLHFMTAPPDAQIPYAVMVLGAIGDGGNGDTSTQEFESTIQFAAFVADDTEAIAAMDPQPVLSAKTMPHQAPPPSPPTKP